MANAASALSLLIEIWAGNIVAVHKKNYDNKSCLKEQPAFNMHDMFKVVVADTFWQLLWLTQNFLQMKKMDWLKIITKIWKQKN